MGSFYVGFDYKNRKNGYLKIGETSKPTPAKRISQIRQTDAFQCLGYIELIDETKAERLLVESYVRVMLERLPELTNVQNDHFIYQIKSKEDKYPQANKFANYALYYAEKICKDYGIKFKVGNIK